MDCPNDRYVNDEAICTAVVAMLARIGVRVTLAAQTRARYFAEINAPRYNTSFYLLGWTPATSTRTTRCSTWPARGTARAACSTTAATPTRSSTG